MYFKRRIIFSLSVLFMLSCSSENEQTPNYVEISLNKGARKIRDLECLAHFPETIESYLRAELNNEQLIKFWNCTAYAVELYQEYSRPNLNQHYSAQGIKNFLVKYLWGNQDFTSKLLHEFMVLKKVLLGGSVEYFTHNEFTKLRNFLAVDMLKFTSQLQPHLRVLFSGVLLPKDETISEEDMNHSLSVLRGIMSELGARFGLHQETYSFSNLTTLLHELEPLFVANSPQSKFTNIGKYIPAIQETKVLLVGPDREKINPNEWSGFFVTLGHVYGIWLRVENFIDENNFTGDQSLNQLYLILDEMIAHIKVGISTRVDQVYTNQEATRLFSAINQVITFPAGLGEDKVIAELWPWLVDKILAADTKKPNRSGLTLEKLSSLHQQLQSWYRIQKHINLTHGPNFDPAHPELGELQRVVKNTPVRLNFDSKGRLQLPSHNSGFERESLTWLNLERAGIHLLMKAYIEDEQRRLSLAGLTIPEVESLIEDIKPVLVQLEFMSPDDDRFARRIYRDTNLFVPQANGNDMVEFAEAVEFLHYVVAGSNANDILLELLPVACRKEGRENKIDRQCLETSFLFNIEEILGHLPQLKSYVMGLFLTDPQALARFIENLEETVGGPNIHLGEISTGDLFELNVLLQYVETFLIKFDLDGDQNLSPLETQLFLDKHILPIAKLVGYDPDQFSDVIRAYFTYLIKFHRSLLDEEDLGRDLRFGYWKEAQPFWEFHGSRFDLSFVLVNL